MAKINGLELKNIKKLTGHEGELIYKANIYLEGKKLGEWEQDYMSGPDEIEFSNEYDMNKLIAKIVELNKGKADPFNCELAETEDYSAWGTLKEVCLEILLPDIATLKDRESQFKKYVRQYGHSVGVVFATDGTGIHEYMMLYPKDIGKDAAIEKMKNENLKFYKNKKANFMAYESLDDFSLFEEIKLSDIYSDKYIAKRKQKDRQR